MNRPVASCDAASGLKLQDANVASVCGAGGRAASCADNKPFVVARNLSMGFAAAAVSGSHGLTGDANCGQCYELRFTSQTHGHWGGSHPQLEGRSMVVQITNIGYDVTGDHSFDIQIPGAGQGLFTTGCARQFGGSSGDFDCDNAYGGCSTKSGCSRLPLALRAGCEWRYDWFMYMQGNGGKTNNPFVDFRRVKCPAQLTAISGSTPTDDNSFPSIVVSTYA